MAKRDWGGGGGCLSAKQKFLRQESDNLELDSCTGMIPWLFNDSPPRSSKR